MDRYRFNLLSYSLTRERILNNNTLSSFEKDALYGYDLDTLYLDKAIELETDLTMKKSNYPSILKPIMDLLNTVDSVDFCSKILKDNSTRTNQSEAVTDIRVPANLVGTIPYQDLVPLFQL